MGVLAVAKVTMETCPYKQMQTVHSENSYKPYISGLNLQVCVKETVCDSNSVLSSSSSIPEVSLLGQRGATAYHFMTHLLLSSSSFIYLVPYKTITFVFFYGSKQFGQ